MALLELRRRGSTFLFVVVVVGHIVLISAQVTSKSGIPVLQAVTFGLAAQVQRAGAFVTGGVSSLWYGYFDLRHIRSDNARLQHDLDVTRVALQQERAMAARTEELSRLLDLKKRTALETTAAEILAGSASPEFRSITIDKGLSDGLRPDMAVIAPTGVVGRVVTPTAGAAKVQLLVDRNAAAGALIERSRSQGVVLGGGGSTLRLDFVSDSADVRVGDTVVTSGIDGIYPSGFVIGRVSQVDRSSGAYHAIAIQPAVDFSSLEDVLVVLSPLLPVTASTPAPAPVTPDPGPPPAARPSAAPSVATPAVSSARPAPPKPPKPVPAAPPVTPPRNPGQ